MADPQDEPNDQPNRRVVPEGDPNMQPVVQADNTARPTILSIISVYLNKFCGGPLDSPDPPEFHSLGFSVFIAFISLILTSLLNRGAFNDLRDSDILIGSFGATAVLLYHAIKSPLAQPTNCIGGHLVSAVIGVSVVKLMPSNYPLFTGPLAVALAIAGMGITNTMHPPGGATAIIAVIGSDSLKATGFMFVLYPVLTGIVTMVACAVVLNNLHPNRQYPLYWFNSHKRQNQKN